MSNDSPRLNLPDVFDLLRVADLFAPCRLAPLPSPLLGLPGWVRLFCDDGDFDGIWSVLVRLDDGIDSAIQRSFSALRV